MLLTSLPVRPGRSPFHVRGSTYLGVRAWVESSVPGGFPAVLNPISDDDLKSFVSQVFLPVGLYDVLPLRPFTEAVALAEGRAYDESVRARARAVAHRDISGLYKLLLRAVSPKMALERLQRVAHRYFDFGATSSRPLGDRRVELTHAEMPRLIAPWFMPMLEGYASTVLEMSGARSPRIRFLAPERDGEREAIETVAIRFEVTWS